MNKTIYEIDGGTAKLKQFAELIAADAALKAAVRDVQKQTGTLLAAIVLPLSVINQVAKTALLHTRTA